jgi:polar amino acid transport system substrate-binding protein
MTPDCFVRSPVSWVRHSLAIRGGLILCAVAALVVTEATIVATPEVSLAPTGTLRAAFLETNPVHARIDSRTGAITGPVVDLTEELARRLGVPFRMIPAADVAAVIRNVNEGSADVGFLAYDEGRARQVDFAGGFAVMFSTYIVKASAPLKTVDDADRAGIRVGAVRGQTQQLYVSSALKQAQVRIFDTTPDAPEMERMLTSGELDAFALNRQRAEELSAASKGTLRPLTGSYINVEQSFVVRKGQQENADFLKRLVEELKASGFIKASIDRARIVGAGVAPRTP